MCLRGWGQLSSYLQIYWAFSAGGERKAIGDWQGCSGLPALEGAWQLVEEEKSSVCFLLISQGRSAIPSPLLPLCLFQLPCRAVPLCSQDGYFSISPHGQRFLGDSHESRRVCTWSPISHSELLRVSLMAEEVATSFRACTCLFPPSPWNLILVFPSDALLSMPISTGRCHAAPVAKARSMTTDNRADDLSHGVPDIGLSQS